MTQDINYKDIKLGKKGYTYRVYTNGKIFNITRNVEVATHINNVGYYVFILDKIYLVHRIVALLFIDNPNNYKYINHKNEIKTDNRVENLEWCTNRYNSEYSVAKKVFRYNFKGELLNTYISTQRATDEGFNGNMISKCCRGDKKSYNNNIWSYRELTKEEVLNKINNKGNRNYKVRRYYKYDNSIQNIYKNVYDVSKFLNVTHSTVCYYIRNHVCVNGFYYEFMKE